ncbi:MAG: hypothetical protein ACI8PZ_007058 [Myxococcota bacterium]|jgi:hypothetical protein
MARRVEQGSRVRERVPVEVPDFKAALVPFHMPLPAPTTPQPIAAGKLTGAMATWFALILGVCYVAVPTARASVGLLDNLVGHMAFNIPAFVFTAFVVTIGAAVARPDVRLSTDSPRDPVLAASAGGLLAWAVICNLSPILQPFWAMGAGELASFVAANVVEMGLIGMMLASFTRSAGKAFALGALFQVLMLGMVTGLFVL